MDPQGQPALTMNVKGVSTSAELSKYQSRGTTRLIARTTIDAFAIGKDEPELRFKRELSVLRLIQFYKLWSGVCLIFCSNGGLGLDAICASIQFYKPYELFLFY